MPRRSILSAAERASLLLPPDTEDELIRHYAFGETDLSLIRQRRGDANRLGVAVQLCLLRFPGQGLLPDASMPMSLLQWIGRQLRIDPSCWPQYAAREETRREHLLELRAYLGVEPFGLTHYRQAVLATTELALQTDKGIVLAVSVLDTLRHRHIILPTLDVIERVCAEGITRANRRIYEALFEPLADTHRHRLDDLLKRRDNGKTTWLAWLRQSPVKPNSRHMLEHIERLKAWQALDLPTGIERLVHQNRLLKIAREGGQMTPADLAKFEPQRRYATLVALAIEGMATVTDEIIDPARPHPGQAVQRRQEQASAAVPGIGQSHQRQGAPVRAHRPGADRRQTIGRRPICRYRGRDVLGCVRCERHRGAKARAAR